MLLLKIALALATVIGGWYAANNPKTVTPGDPPPCASKICQP